MNKTEALVICQNLVDNEYTLRDRDLRCDLCGNKVILTLPETPGQHKETCEIARAKAALTALKEMQWICFARTVDTGIEMRITPSATINAIMGIRTVCAIASQQVSRIGTSPSDRNR